MDRLMRFGVSIPKGLLSRFDKIAGKKGYANRSEAIRDLMRDDVVEEEWSKDEDVVGTVTLVFNHEVTSIIRKLLRLQHDNQRLVLSSMHLHLDKDNCLEVLILMGKASEVKNLAERMIATKGIKHGRFVRTTMGRNVT